MYPSVKTFTLQVREASRREREREREIPASSWNDQERNIFFMPERLQNIFFFFFLKKEQEHHYDFRPSPRKNNNNNKTMLDKDYSLQVN